ncbi:NUMOD4 domain-containing protein [Lactiplantibacillus plantarum]|uniref:NUMOD4 domain-containing protein n=1 Tax=Lactiplantibacillus plantarum TaxID=1590 RepID=UPI003CF4E25B
MKEVWKKIRGYTGYEVSNLGRIKSNGRKIIQSNGHPMTLPSKILKLNVSDRGYLYVVLAENKKHTTKRVHRLVK